jgi:hypothetical protein
VKSVFSVQSGPPPVTSKTVAVGAAIVTGREPVFATVTDATHESPGPMGSGQLTAPGANTRPGAPAPLTEIETVPAVTVPVSESSVVKAARVLPAATSEIAPAMIAALKNTVRGKLRSMLI